MGKCWRSSRSDLDGHLFALSSASILFLNRNTDRKNPGTDSGGIKAGREIFITFHPASTDDFVISFVNESKFCVTRYFRSETINFERFFCIYKVAIKNEFSYKNVESALN